MGRQRKNFTVDKDKLKKVSVTEPVFGAELNQEVVRPIHPVVNYPSLGSHGGNGFNFDFSKYYGKGYDDITNRAYYTAKVLLKNTKDLSESTQYGYFTAGFANFADYLELFGHAAGHDLTQENITPELIENFLIHLRNEELSYISQKAIYTFLKSLLIRMREKGYWLVDNTVNLNSDFFPQNPFPNSNKRCTGQKPFSQHEERQLVVALKQAMQPIYGKTTPLTGYELTVCLLFIAMKTGINTTPLLKMTVDALTDHPLKENRKLLTVFKKRGNATQLHNLRKSESIESTLGVKLDVASIIERIIELNAKLRMKGNTELVFVYETLRGGKLAPSGTLTSLSDGLLIVNIKKLIETYDLKDEDERPLKITIGRIRKTFINGIYELSGESLAVTASLAKHSGTGTLDHYLEAPAQSKRNLGLMGEIRVKELTCDALRVIPVGHCKDPLHGDKAPKNGAMCNNFLDCFRCKTFVITGDDLYKLFSFYWAIVRNRDEFGRKDWKRHLRNILQIVDEEVVPAFTKQGWLRRIEQEKEQSRVNPHPYWVNLEMLRVVHE